METIIKKINLYERFGYVKLNYDYPIGTFIKITNIISNKPEFIFKNTSKKIIDYEFNNIMIEFEIIGNKNFKSNDTIIINAKITIYKPKYEWIAYNMNNEQIDSELTDNVIKKLNGDSNTKYCETYDNSDDDLHYESIVTCARKEIINNNIIIFKKQMTNYVLYKKFNINSSVIYHRNKIRKIQLFDNIYSVLSLKFDYNFAVSVVANKYQITYKPIDQNCYIDFTTDYTDGFIWWDSFCNKIQGLQCYSIDDLYLKIIPHIGVDDSIYDSINVEMKVLKLF